jgi:hypothetical protein
VIATVARLLCRELTLQNRYLRVENRILREKVSGRIPFTDQERRPLMRVSSALETALRALWGTDEFLDRTPIMTARYSEFADVERRWAFARADITNGIRLPSAR